MSTESHDVRFACFANVTCATFTRISIERTMLSVSDIVGCYVLISVTVKSVIWWIVPMSSVADIFNFRLSDP